MTTQIALGTQDINKEFLCFEHIRFDNNLMFDASRNHRSSHQYIFFLQSTLPIIIKFPNAREPPFDILLFITILSMVNQSVYLSTVSTFGIIQFTTMCILRTEPISKTCLIHSTTSALLPAHFDFLRRWAPLFTTLFFAYITPAKLKIHSKVRIVVFSMGEVE